MEQKKCYPKNESKNFYLLSGICRCECGGAMTGYTLRKPNGKTYSYYKCHNHTSKGSKICAGNTVAREFLETFVTSKIRANEGVNLDMFPDGKKREFVLQKVKGITVGKNKNIFVRFDNSNFV
jgi:hypothetical protein